LAPSREAFKAKVAELYPGKPGAVPVNAGQLFRFVHEMKVGDLVVYPSKQDRQVHLGQIEGKYQFDPKTEPGYPHIRAVKWLRHLPRNQFSQGALYEIGSAMSLFRVKDYADTFRAAFEEKQMPVSPVVQDETVAKTAEDVEETTKDFVLKRLALSLTCWNAWDTMLG
jgi:restriction system protein